MLIDFLGRAPSGSHVQTSAIHILERLGAQALPAQEQLIRIASTPGGARTAAAKALAAIGADPAKAGPAIATLFKQANIGDRNWARATLLALGEGVVPALEPYLASDDEALQHQALSVIRALDPLPVSAIPMLIDTLSGENRRIVNRAIDTLGKFGPAASAAVPALETLAGSDDIEKSYEAQDALVQIRGGVD